MDFISIIKVKKSFVVLSYISHCSRQSGEVVFSHTAVTNLAFPIEIVQKALIPIYKSIRSILKFLFYTSTFAFIW